MIAVDAMGGDHAPGEIVAGALAAQREHGIRVLLTGPAPRLRQVLGGMGAIDEVQVMPAEDNLAMDEGALASLRRPRSSVAVACQLVRRGDAAAVVSAGSTGGIVATARLRLRALPGVLRPGLAVVLPTRPGRTVLIDAGATADPKPEMLVQFGQLGVAYAQTALGVAAPRVGLLTIGTEPGKGNKFTRRAHELLASDPPHGALPLSFAGNVEGGDLLAGQLDVIVTDGFTGNVALKTLEGSIRFAAAELRAAVTATRTARVGAFLQRRGLRELTARLDAESYGGAVLLGLGGTVVIAHGASTARAVTSACLLAADLARGQITEKITQRLGPGRSAARGGHFLRRPLRSEPAAAGLPPISLGHGRSTAGSQRPGARRHRRVVRPGVRRRRPADPAVLVRGLPGQRGPAARQAAAPLAAGGGRRAGRPAGRGGHLRRAGSQRARLHQPHPARRLDRRPGLADARRPRLGLAPTASPQTVVVEYSSPNVAKEMHVGHLRTTIVGDAIARVLEFAGHRVIRDNHVGDWGTPFGMLIEHLLDVGEHSAEAALLTTDPNAFYQAARRKFDNDPAFTERARSRLVQLQAGDPATMTIWQRLVDISRGYLHQVYTRLGVSLTDDDIRGESFYNDLLADTVSLLEKKASRP